MIGEKAGCAPTLPSGFCSGTFWLNLGDSYNTPINWRQEDYSYSSLGAEGNGLPGVSELDFAPAKVKLVKVTLTGAQRGHPWSLYELDLIQPAALPR